ncbi:trypsin-like peptidase domain-containing protein [Nesterenkonia flava]
MHEQHGFAAGNPADSARQEPQAQHHAGAADQPAPYGWGSPSGGGDHNLPWELRPAPAGMDPAHLRPAHHHDDGRSIFEAPPRKKERRGIGAGGFLAGVLIAGLIGGGIGAFGYGYLQDEGPEQSVQQANTGPGIEINTPEDATVITAAAAKAAPSVVTLGVSDGNNAGSGSGIILDDQGHVLTNTHVVTLGGATGDPDIQVRLNDGRVTTAELVGTDPLSDLAVVRLAETENITPAELGSSGDLNVGDQTIAIGAPLGLPDTVTTGIVSTLNRTIQVASAAVDEEETGDVVEPEEPEDQDPGEPEGFEFYFPDQPDQPAQSSIALNVIQTDAAINQGNSGGALVDTEGNIIGVNVAIASSGGMFGADQAGNIGVGFAIPIDYAQRIAQELIDTGEATHGLLGVQVTLPDAQSAGQGGASAAAGALVQDVSAQSPAAEGGLQDGDVITEVEGRRIEDPVALTATIREYAPGETITVTYLRDGEAAEAEVTLSGM